MRRAQYVAALGISVTLAACGSSTSSSNKSSTSTPSTATSSAQGTGASSTGETEHQEAVRTEESRGIKPAVKPPPGAIRYPYPTSVQHNFETIIEGEGATHALAECIVVRAETNIPLSQSLSVAGVIVRGIKHEGSGKLPKGFEEDEHECLQALK